MRAPFFLTGAAAPIALGLPVARAAVRSFHV
jgi:hypothetical protein